MAKKKSSPASPFVPEEEQPYPIPENWCWTRLKVLVEASKEKTNDFSNGDTKYVGLEHIEKDGGIIGYSSATEVKSLKAIFHVGQILYGKLRPYLNKHDIAGFEGVCSTDILVFDTKNCADCRYVNYFFNQRYFIEYAVSNSKGINLPRVSESIILEAICPLPPLPEQHRIVNRIESLFAKLDEAKEKAQAVVDGFELRKSAILHKAFTGELTERWRKEHNKSDSDWQSVRFDEAAEIMSNLVDPADYQDFPHIAPDNIEKRTGVLLEYHTIAEDGVKSGKHLFHTGQILYSKIRPYLSKVVMVDFDGLCSADMYPVNAKEDTRYLWYYMLSDEFLEQASNAGSRSVLPKINQKELSKVMVRMTSLEEQRAIVTILDDIFEKEQQAKEAASTVLSQIDTMKKAILARAFRGELGTNNPEEEWAGELLKKTL